MSRPTFTVPVESAVIIHQAVARMYHYARDIPAQGYRQAVIEQLEEIVVFDQVYWVSFADDSVPCDGRGALTSSLSNEFVAGFHRLIGTKLAKQQPMSSTGLAVVTPCDGWLQEQNISEFLHYQGVKHQQFLTIEYGGVRHVLCLYRTAKDQPFEQYELNVIGFMAENMARAYNQFLQNRLADKWTHNDGFKAICDLYGGLLACGIGFDHRLQQLVPNWQSVFMNELSSRKLPAKIQFDRFQLKLAQEEGLCLLEIYPFDEQIEKLTSAEFEVARFLTTGLTAQQIADAKGVSCRTIDNQLSSIRKKLEVKKNTELISILLLSDYNFTN